MAISPALCARRLPAFSDWRTVFNVCLPTVEHKSDNVLANLALIPFTANVRGRIITMTSVTIAKLFINSL
jgi:hypothetical protein